MARKCSVCSHPKHKEIDRLLVEGVVSKRTIATRFEINISSVKRHANSHLLTKMVKAQEAKELTEADSLLGQVKDLLKEALKILKKAQKKESWGHATAAIREARGCMEFLGRLSGELKNDKTEINIYNNPKWIIVKEVIIEALGPHPEARAAVFKALEDFSGAGA